MTKPITTFFFVLLLWCNFVNGQCSIDDPLQGVTIQKATFLCGSELDGYSGKLPATNSPEAFQPADLCAGSPGGGGQPDNILWFSFIATSFSFDLDIFYGNCNASPGHTVQVGVYGDQNFDEKVACNSFPISSPANLSTNSAVPGKVYYLYVDGFESATCDFTIRVNSGINTNPYIFEVEDDITGISQVDNGGLVQDNANVCAGNGIIYTYTAPLCEASAGAFGLDSFQNLELFCYDWTISPPGSGVIIGDQNGRVIDIDWEVPGNYTLSVDITPLPELDACAPSLCTTAADLQITSAPIVPESRDTIFFCLQDPPIFCGEEILETTTLTCVDNNANCIEVMQPFKLLENDTIDYGTFINCGDNNCFYLFGFEYCINGQYILPDTGACNIFHKFEIEGFFVDVNLPSSMELDCANGNLMLNPMVNTNYEGEIEYEWTDGTTVIGNEINVNINGIGTYELTLSFPDLSDDCGTTQRIEITESMSSPEFQLVIPELNCAQSIGTLKFIEVDPIMNISWSGPNGFSSNNNVITLNQGGEFTLNIMGANGCETDTTFMVVEDFESPAVNLEVDDLNCIIRNTTARFTSNKPISSAQWTLENGAVLIQDTIDVTLPGDYELNVIGANGCSTTQPFTIEENLDTPMVDAGSDMVWQCNTKSLTIEGMVSEGPHEIDWSFVEKGDILSEKNKSSIEVGSEGTYILKALNFISGCEMSDSISIVRNEDIPEEMEYVKVDPSCFETKDGMIQVTDVIGGTEPYRFFINGLQTEQDFIENLSAGLYTIMVLDDYDCRLTIDVNVEEQQEISLDEMPSKITIGYNELYTFYAQHNLAPEDIQAINWYNESGALIGEADTLNFQTQQNTEITVEVINVNGCSALRSIPIEVDFDLPVYAPNVFSPNEDGVNDYFTLFKRGDYPSIILSLSIHNRWGEQVFFKENFPFDEESEGWDGRKNGQMCSNAVFTYVATVELVDGEQKLVKGEVTLIR